MKILKTALLLTLMLLAGTICAAAYDFDCMRISPSTVIQNTDKKYRHNGGEEASVYYYGYLRNAEVSSDEVMTEAWGSMCYGGGSVLSDAAANMLVFTFETPEMIVEANDTVYISFFYKNASSFTGKDGVEYAGNEITPLLTFGDKSVVMNTLGAADGAVTPLKADDKWHRMDCFVTISEEQLNNIFAGTITKKELRVSMLELDKAFFVELADMSIGLLKAGEDTSFEKTASDISDALCDVMPESITVNGERILLRSGVLQYTARWSDAAEVEVTDQGGVPIAAVAEQIDTDTIEVKLYAIGYNKYDGEGEKIPLLVLRDGVLTLTEKENSEFCGIITIVKEHIEAQIQITLNGEEVQTAFFPQSGDSAQIRIVFDNRQEAKTYIALVILKKDGALLSAAAYKKTLTEGSAATEAAIEHTFSDVAEGAQAEILLINAQTFAAVAE
ncbi:MAG: hypothetical protein Q4C12_01770 [Clostridia bacterium]|nr:hypothetical protein [Clostridia bacterium]